MRKLYIVFLAALLTSCYDQEQIRARNYLVSLYPSGKVHLIPGEFNRFLVEKSDGSTLYVQTEVSYSSNKYKTKVRNEYQVR